jgi:hypothetical protein
LSTIRVLTRGLGLACALAALGPALGCVVVEPGEAPTVADPGPDPRPVDPGPGPGPGPIDPGPVPPPPPPPQYPVGTSTAGTARNCDVDQLSEPHVYGHKVKTLLTGLPLDADELRRLQADPTALPDLIDTWLGTPEAEGVLRRWFATAFQQDGVDAEGLADMLGRNNLNWGRLASGEPVATRLMDSLKESFARTALRIVREGRPFTEVLTTDRFELNTALLFTHALLEQRFVKDDGSIERRPAPELTGFVALRNAGDEPPDAQVLDPQSPRFMRIHLPNFADLCLPADVDEWPFDASAIQGRDPIAFVLSVIVGRPDRVVNRAAGGTCAAAPGLRRSLLTDADFADWRTVRLRPARAADTPPRFYELPRLRTAEELPVRSDRVGFFTTLGFLATWPTNEDNQARVTINQTLITALGQSFDGATVTDFSPPNLDADHSGPGTPCYGCHQTLDPMREYFRQSYSYGYGEQTDRARREAMAHFVFRGARAQGTGGVRELAATLAAHPDFAPGWAQKLCFYTNSAPCPAESEAFRGAVDAFRSSGHDLRVLIRSLLASPLVTHADCIEGGTGGLRSISRQHQLCTALSSRLGIADVCGLETPARGRSLLQRRVFAAIGAVPADTFSRGEVEPVTIRETGLFTRATREVVCREVAERAYAEAFRGLGREAAIDRIVTRVMGLPEGDPRRAEALEIVGEHVAEAIAGRATEAQAVQSALLVACMSPGLAGVGF